MDCALTRQGNSDLTSVFWEQWTEYQDQLYRCCLKLMNSNPTDAEDALSQAMLKAWEKVQKYAGKIANFKAWLIKLTRNLCIDIIRERSRGAGSLESIEWVGETDEMGIASTVASPDICLEREEKSSEIRQAIADLPETLRDTFILHFYQEQTHIEIAQRQGISYDNVCRRIYQARKRLKERLSGYFLETLEKVSVTARDRKSSTLQENGENQQRIESEDQITATVSPSPHLPIPPSQPEVVEAEQAESVVQLDSISKDNRYFEKISNFIKPFLGTGSKSSQKNLFLYYPLSEKISSFLSVAYCLSTASKSCQKKSLTCCLSREQTQWLKPSVMWRSLTGDNTKSGRRSRLMGEMKFFLNVQSLLKDVQWIWHRSLMDTGG